MLKINNFNWRGCRVIPMVITRKDGEALGFKLVDKDYKEEKEAIMIELDDFVIKQLKDILNRND